MFAIIILALVLLLISMRQFVKISFSIPQVMAAGALIVLLFGSISIRDAFSSVKWEMIIFLFCMFVLSAALESSGLLEEAMNALMGKSEGKKQAVLLLIIFFALGSAFLVNDALAVIAAPMVIYLSAKMGMEPKPLLLICCFAITIGSMATPIGNPQNLLVALDFAVGEPFSAFFTYLFLPALASLIFLYFLSPILWKNLFSGKKIEMSNIPMVRDKPLAKLCASSIFLFALLFILHLIFPNAGLPLWWIAAPPALLLLILSSRRKELFLHVEWGTLLFFISMFVLMQSVWNEGIFQQALAQNSKLLNPSDPISVSFISVILSQFISNVPMVALYLPILHGAKATIFSYMALAGASTLAGNLTILGAASNIILIEGARKRGVHISFFEFLKYGIVFTAIPILLMLGWFAIFGAL